MKKAFLLFVFSLCVFYSKGQYKCNYSIRVDKGFDSLQYAWVGGLNNPQFSEVDMNEDNIPDLFIFDKTDYKVLTFINHGTPNTADYEYAPQYQKYFPAMENWALLVDFNCDGVQDIFTFTTLGIQVYKGFYVDNHISFTLYSSLLRFDYIGVGGNHFRTNVPVSSIDIPAICDINNDGDIDIMTFDSQSGNYEQYYENVSQEGGYGCDTLFFKMTDLCWGKMYERPNSDEKLLFQPCLLEMPLLNDDGNIDVVTHGQTRHIGSTTLCFDNTGDGVKEIFIGDISFNNIVYLVNGGTLDDALLTSQDTTFPSYDHISDLPAFPAAFRMDVNNDGVKDLLMAPNAPIGSNFSACSWLYKNVGNDSVGDFRFQTDSFLVSQMIDVGSGAKPVFFDYNNDGLTDVVLSNEGYYNSYSHLALYKNTGTATKPRFKFVTNDFNNLSALHLRYMHPALGDLDNDGDKDMLVGSQKGRLYYFQNNPVGQTASFSLQDTNYFSIFNGSGTFSAPQLVDVNNDGLLDILLGTYNGKIQYYQNSGTVSSPNFSVVTTKTFGNVNVGGGSPVVISVPCLTTLPGYTGKVLLVANALGKLQLYDNVEGNLGGTFNLVTSSYSGIVTGENNGFSPASISTADINNDGAVELAVGLYRGGFQLYDTSSVDLEVGIREAIKPGFMFELYPNPSASNIYIKVNTAFKNSGYNISIVNVLGQAVMQKNIVLGNGAGQVDISSLPAGLYVLQLSNSQQTAEKKFLKY